MTTPLLPSALPPDAATTAALLHELHVHQIELETQNEELRRTQLDLAAARDRFVDLYDFAPVGYFTLDDAGSVVEANLTGAQLLDEPRKALLGRRFAHFVTAPDADRWHRHLQAVQRSDGSQCIELGLRRRHGETFHAQLDCLRVAGAGEAPGLRVTLTDVTPRKLAEADRRMADAAVETREAERRSIARELHDELGQRLSALKMELASLCAQATPAPQSARVSAMLETLDEAVATVRRIAAELRPLMLDDLGLNAAIDWLVRDTARRTGLDVTLHADDGDAALDARISIALYRMVQETLADISERRHGGDVRVELHRRSQELVIGIEEGGIGVPAAAGAGARLDTAQTLRDRARMIGGRVELGPAPNGGHRTTIRLPLAAATTVTNPRPSHDRT
jgi:PAS domain S-box-containing protein